MKLIIISILLVLNESSAWILCVMVLYSPATKQFPNDVRLKVNWLWDVHFSRSSYSNLNVRAIVNISKHTYTMKCSNYPIWKSSVSTTSRLFWDMIRLVSCSLIVFRLSFSCFFQYLDDLQPLFSGFHQFFRIFLIISQPVVLCPKNSQIRENFRFGLGYGEAILQTFRILEKLKTKILDAKTFEYDTLGQIRSWNNNLLAPKDFPTKQIPFDVFIGFAVVLG